MDTSTTLFYVPGQSKTDTLSEPLWTPGLAFINGPFTEAFKNIGRTPLRWLKIDVHRPRDFEIPRKLAYDSATDAFTLGGAAIQKLAVTLGIKMFIATLKAGDVQLCIHILIMQSMYFRAANWRLHSKVVFG